MYAHSTQLTQRLITLVLELAEAVDNAYDDIGGSRPQLEILREAIVIAQTLKGMVR